MSWLMFVLPVLVICVLLASYYTVSFISHVLDVPPSAPSPPASFSLSARNEIGTFDVISASGSQETPADELSAFIFKIDDGKRSYIVQV